MFTFKLRIVIRILLLMSLVLAQSFDDQTFTIQAILVVFVPDDTRVLIILTRIHFYHVQILVQTPNHTPTVR